jgi:Flp pilus assembly protein TadD
MKQNPTVRCQASQGKADQEMRIGLGLLKSQQWDDAEKHLKAAAKLDPALRDQIRALAEEAFGKGRYQESLCLIQSIGEYVPDAASFHSMAGACYYHLQNPALAVKEVQAAVHLDPRNEDYYIQLAQIFLDYNTPEPCILLLEPAQRLFPSSARIRFVLGVAYLKASKFHEARESLAESLQMQAQNPLASQALAMAYEGDEDWKDLLEFAGRVSVFRGREYEAYYYQAEAYYNIYRGHPYRIQRVEELLNQSLQANPKFAMSYFLMGKLQAENGSYKEAVQNLERATTLQPDLAAAYYNLGMAYRKLGDAQKSSRAFEKFRAVNKNKKQSERSLRYDVDATVEH